MKIVQVHSPVFEVNGEKMCVETTHWPDSRNGLMGWFHDLKQDKIETLYIFTIYTEMASISAVSGTTDMVKFHWIRYKKVYYEQYRSKLQRIIIPYP